MQLITVSVLSLSALALQVTALGQKPIISFSSSANSFQIAGGSISVGQIRISPNEYWGVIRAANDLALDFGRVTGTNYSISNGISSSAPASYVYNPINNMNNTYFSTTGTAQFPGPTYADPSPSNTVIIAGTIGHSEVIDSLISSNAIDVSEIKGKWEAFVTQVVANPIPGVARALVIAGSDPRGSIYGIYDVSEQMGVSPWYFWADVPTKQHKEIFALVEKKTQLSPSVKYRGFFINDEQPDLTNWVSERWPDTPYGAGYEHRFYALVFEVLLRNRANYLWPALWGTMFPVDDPANQALADAYEIVMGTSHTEPLMRAQNEFGTFYKGPWAYNLNNDTIDDYFRYGVQRAKPYARNSLWTMGMRGTGDTAISGLGVDKIVSMLTTLVQNQQKIMEEGLGVNRSDIPQAWCLYKEVQTYIFEGLVVPDDITLLWADDNWGNVRRFPLKNETSRHGGAGVYYHFDYVGDPRNYKWVNTVQLSKTAEQMHMAYARGADRIWVVNVGDIKAQEIPISHFFDIAYDAKRWGVDDTLKWTEAWATREFGAEYANDIAEIMMTYGMYAARRKFELVEPNTYSVLHYHEADAVLEQWAVLHAEAQVVYDRLPEAYKPAFFQMVLHPILGGETLYKIQIGSAKNQLYAGQKRNSANEMIKQILAASDDDANLTVRWNKMLDGKWAHMMDQTHLGYDGYWQQPMRNTLPDVRYVQTAFASLAGHVGIGVEGSNATIQGDDKYHDNTSNNLRVPPMDPYGPITRYFDVFTRGTQDCVWNAAPHNAPWVKLSRYTGTVGPGPEGGDTRVYISVDWEAAPRAPSSTLVSINVTTPCRGKDKYGFGLPLVQVPINNRALPSNFTGGFVEADGQVSFEGVHYQRIAPASRAAAAANSSAAASGNLTYHRFENYGRTGSGVGLWPMDTDKLPAEEVPALEYDLYLFSNHSRANVTVFISPSHNYLGDWNPLAYAVSLYPAGSGSPPAPVVVNPVGPSIGSNLPAGWGFAVADAVWGRYGNYSTRSFNVAQEGAYKLRIWALMPSVVVQKVVVDLGGVRPSYLGPPESFLVGRDQRGVYNQTSFLNVVGTVGGAGNGNLTKLGLAVGAGQAQNAAARLGGAGGVLAGLMWAVAGWAVLLVVM